MTDRIDAEYRRILEDRVDPILAKHLSSPTALARWFIERCFGEGRELVAVDTATVREPGDYRKESGDPLAYGQTDVRVGAKVMAPSGGERRICILIEDKVDANQGDKQGLRYGARAAYGTKMGWWAEARCVLVAPQRYLEGAYPLGDFKDDGWDSTIAFEEIAEVLNSDPSAVEDVVTLIEAAKASNAFNKPNPAAVLFWKRYVAFARDFYSEVSVLVNTQKGSRAGGVWPSFFEDQLRGRKGDPWRRRVQIVHIDTRGSHVSLFVKRVNYSEFAAVVGGILEPGMRLAPSGGSWQSVQISVPLVDPRQPFDAQTNAVHQVFRSAHRLFDFFLRHEHALRHLPVVQPAARARRRRDADDLQPV